MCMYTARTFMLQAKSFVHVMHLESWTTIVTLLEKSSLLLLTETLKSIHIIVSSNHLPAHPLQTFYIFFRKIEHVNIEH